MATARLPAADPASRAPALLLGLLHLSGLAAVALSLYHAEPLLAAAGALLAMLTRHAHAWQPRSAAELLATLLPGAVCALLALAVNPAAAAWQVPAQPADLLTLSPWGAPLLGLVYLAWARAASAAARVDAHLAWLAAPLLFNGLLLLAAAPLLDQLAHRLVETSLTPAQLNFVARCALLFAFNELIILGTGWLMDRRLTAGLRLHAALLACSVLVAASPLIADAAHHPLLAALPWLLQVPAAVLLSAAAQCGLWAETFLITGVLLDALRGRRPTVEAGLAHGRSGLLRGALYAGLFMALVLAVATTTRVDWLLRALAAQPLLGGLLLGMPAFALLKTLVESFDGSSPFFTRLRAAQRDRLNLVRGAIVGGGVGLAFSLALPAAPGSERFMFGFIVGALAYGGADFLRDLREIGHHRRMHLQSVRVYGLGLLLGGLVGGALAWYLDAAQLTALAEKFRAYAALSYAQAGRATQSYVVYPLFSKYGAIDLGSVAGGVKLLYAESLSGVINWSLAAPLFSLNLVLLTALFEKSRAPLRELFTAEGLATLVEQAVRVLRWGLWMAPVIYSFLRLAPDPSWYNQDGAVRTLVATVQALRLSPEDFRAWSLSVFMGLLAYDALRVLIWFDHMGLRVATLVNLSFVGGDKLDERAARFLGHSARTRVIPEGIRRFLTWAPLLIPFYIPRGAEWDQVWDQAAALARSDDPMLPAVAGLLIGYRVLAAALALGAAAWLWRWLRSPAGTATVAAPPPMVLGNGRYFLELHADGRGYSRCESDERPGFVLDLTRRPDDPLSLIGPFLYLRELDPSGAPLGPRWSLMQEPARYGISSLRRVSPTRLHILRIQAGLRVEADVRVAAREPLSTWDLALHNASERARVFELLTYREPVVGPVDAVRRTPAFAGLHVGTVFVRGLGAILSRNRLMRTGQGARISREVGFHAVAGEATLTGFQDGRGEFLGLHTLRDPQATMANPDHQGLRHAFDPCAALRLRVELPAGATRRLRIVDGYARNEQAAAARIARVLSLPPLPADELRALCATPRQGVDNRDAALAAWTDPWSADGRSLRAPVQAQRPWTHVLANPLGHGAVLSSDGAVFAFAVNAQQNAFSPACLESVSAQQPGELCLVRDLDSGQHFGPCRVPLRRDAEHTAEFALGRARYIQQADELELSLDVYADIDEPAQYRVLRIVNRSPRRRRLRVLSLVGVVLAEVGQDSRGRLVGERVAGAAGATLLFSHPRNDFRRGWAFVAHSHAGVAEMQRSAVIGPARDLTQPQLLSSGRIDEHCADDGWRCAAFCHEVDLEPGAAHLGVTALGQTETRDTALDLAQRLAQPVAAQAAHTRLGEFWNQRLGQLRIRTHDAGFDRLVNDWLPYQVQVSRLWGRTGPAQRSGAFGFRDQLQDVLPFCALDPDLARRQVLLHAAQQFREGDALKWWHDSWQGRCGIGVRTRASDPHLWLPYVTLRYVAASGDAAVLDQDVPFLEGVEIPEGHEGRMLAPRPSRDRGSLYEHCRRAVELALAQRGPDGLPLLGSGDWNDGLDAPGIGGRGQSVWMAFFLHEVLRDFATLAATRENGAGDALRYRGQAAELRRIVEDWWREDGYVRATDDAGRELRYADALTASWAVLSGCVDLERGIAALERGCAVLERDARVLLMSPAFDEDSQPYPGRIAEYPPGVRENGGQYSHGSSWLIDAWLRCAELATARGDQALALRCRERARELWWKVSPLSKGGAEELPRYGLPPHQQPADVYEGPGYEGRGGWAWYTGAAARMLSAAYGLVGLRFVDGRAERVPGPAAVPAEITWNGKRIP